MVGGGHGLAIIVTQTTPILPQKSAWGHILHNILIFPLLPKEAVPVCYVVPQSQVVFPSPGTPSNSVNSPRADGRSVTSEDTRSDSGDDDDMDDAAALVNLPVVQSVIRVCTIVAIDSFVADFLSVSGTGMGANGTKVICYIVCNTHILHLPLNMKFYIILHACNRNTPAETYNLNILIPFHLLFSYSFQIFSVHRNFWIYMYTS